MPKKVPAWKQGKIISIETRKGVFVLAQMLKRPYLRFYKAFREDEDWGRIDARVFDTLFTQSVTGQILKFSAVHVVKGAIPDNEREESDIWIKQNSGFRKVKVWENTCDEKEILIMGKEPGGSLVKKNLWWSPSPGNRTRPHPSGVIDAVILDRIPLDADEIIDRHELTSMAVYPELNERLYLCHLFGRNVDPYKDLVFNRDIPKDYGLAMDILSADVASDEEKQRILSHYR